MQTFAIWVSPVFLLLFSDLTNEELLTVAAYTIELGDRSLAFIG
jgi:hypothetical protein